MRRSFKYRLWTTPNQERELGIMLETHRRLYNEMLAMRIASWECDRYSVGYFFQTWCFKGMRLANPYYARLNVVSARFTLRRLDQAYKNFFRRVKSGAAKVGFPHFKGKGRFNSFEYNYKENGIRLAGSHLHVKNIGAIRVNLHRPVEGTGKTARLMLDGDKWYLVLSCDLGEVSVAKSAGTPVGIDVGLQHFLSTSDGEHVANPKFLKRELPALRRASRAVSRKKRGGANRRKAVKQLRRLHARVGNARRDHHHKTALNLCRRYGTVALESLAVKNMVKSKRLARSISDAGWSAFATILQHHGQKSGVEVIAVNPSYTSQLCSACGALVDKDLSERQHVCPCGCSLQRDVNAARNILARGLARTEPTGRNAGNSPRVPRSRRLADEVTAVADACAERPQ